MYLSDFFGFRIKALKLCFDIIEEYDFAYEKDLTQATDKTYLRRLFFV